MRTWLTLLLCLALAACNGGNLADLKQFVENSGQGLRGKAEALPEVKPYEPFAYNAFDLPDPFKPRKLEPTKGSEGGVQPDTNRRKEPLEAFPLENLKLVGFLQKENLNYALVSTPDKELYQVKVGNHMGQNYGIITNIAISGISDAQIKLTEIVQDGTGNWIERQTSIALATDETEQKPSQSSK